MVCEYGKSMKGPANDCVWGSTAYAEVTKPIHALRAEMGSPREGKGSIAQSTAEFN